MIGYRYYWGKDPVPSQGADAEQVLDQLSDLVLRENDISKALDLLKQQGIKPTEESQGLQGIQEFLEQVRRLKQKLQEAMSSSSNPSLLEELKRLEKLEHELRRASWGLDLEKIDAQQIQELLGEESYQLWNQIKSIPRLLEIKGYIEKLGAKYELTPKGMRKIGQRALQDIFATLARDALGNHQTRFRGSGFSFLLEDCKPYQFGDPFHLNLSRTLMNSLGRRNRSSRPAENGCVLELSAEDFEVYQTEKRTRTSVVLMLDMSGSMARDEKFFAAKKVALALHTLIHTQFPHDRLHLVGFSSYARALQSKDLPSLNWDLDNPYTNMEEGLHPGQIIPEPGTRPQQADHHGLGRGADRSPGERKGFFPVPPPSQNTGQDPPGVQEMRDPGHQPQYFHARPGCPPAAIRAGDLQAEPRPGLLHHSPEPRPVSLRRFPRPEAEVDPDVST